MNGHREYAAFASIFRRARLPAIAAAVALLSGCSSLALRYAANLFTAEEPDPSGERSLMVDGIQGPVTIRIDRWGVPLIEADGESDLFYGLGWMHAQDRRFQMELIKTNAQGRLRELIGETTNETVLRLEVFSRMLGFRDEAARVLSTLPSEDRKMLEAYSAGVNAATATRQSAYEFRVLGYDPPPWEPVDTLAIMEMVSFGFCKNWEMELARLEILFHQLSTGSTVERAMAIWPARNDFPPHLIGEKPPVDPWAAVPLLAPELLAYLRSLAANRTAAAIHAAAPAPGSPLPGLFTDAFPASNNWAVGGGWTGTGKAAFAMDPHMPQSIPPLTYLARLRLRDSGRSWSVSGASLIGLPALPFGTNGAVAWGPTANWADITDLYVEKPIPGKPGSYAWREGEERFSSREEVFRIHHEDGSYSQETKTVRSSRHGVIVNDFTARLGPDFPLVALAKPSTFGMSLGALRALYRARSVSEAREALSGFTAMVGHWFLADKDGNIGYASAFPLPNRVGFLGTMPVPGWTGTYEWNGFVPVEKLPWRENPPEGYLGTANNQVVDPESTTFPLNFEGDVPFRLRRILDRLAAGRGPGGIAAQMRALQADGTDMSFLDLKPFLTGALSPLRADPDKSVARAAEILLAWDGTVLPDSPAPSLFEGWVTAAFDRVLRDEVPAGTLKFLQYYFNADPLVFGILNDPSNPAWDDRKTARVEGAGEESVAAFRDAVAALAARHGPAVDGWAWRKVAPFILKHTFGDVAVMSGLNRGPFPTRGTGATVFMHRFTRADPAFAPILHGPVLRLVVDFSDPGASTMSIAGGQSGRPASKHYDDILSLYLADNGVPVFADAPTGAVPDARASAVPGGALINLIPR